MNAPLEPSELLTPEPLVLTDIRIGYARVSTGGQKLDRQYDGLKAAGTDKDCWALQALPAAGSR